MTVAATPAGDRSAASRATIQIVLATVCFSTISIFVVLATRAGAPLLTILTGRYAVAALLLIALQLRSGTLAIGRPLALRIAIVLGGLQAIATYVTFAALEFIPAATMVFLFYTYPAWVALGAAIRRTEPIDRTKAAALALSLGGVALIVGSPGGTKLHPGGVALSLVGAMLYAIYIPLVSRLQRGISPQALTTYIALGVTAIVAPIAAATGRLSFALPAAGWGGILGLAVVSTVLAMTLLFRGLATLGPVRTSIIATVEPFWTAVLGAVILSQPFSAGVLLGGSLIAVAVLLLQRSVAR